MDLIESIVTGDGNIEIIGRNLLDITLKCVWTIKDYIKLWEKRTNLDSPSFDFHLNGLKTKWSMAIRFWFNEDGKTLSNPVVICLNLLSCSSTNEQLQIQYQFGLWNDVVKQFEVCPIADQQVTLSEETSSKITCVGYREVYIIDNHLKENNVEMFCNIKLIRKTFEQNTLSLDLLDKLNRKEYCDVTLISSEGDRFQAHKIIISCRSKVLHELINKNIGNENNVQLAVSTKVLTGLIQYIYTDRVDPLKNPTALLKAAHNYEIPGLKNLCEKNLVDSITPFNVGNMLMISDTFSCENLKKASLAYVEQNGRSIVKTIAWKFMEHVNPELFEEVCQSQG